MNTSYDQDPLYGNQNVVLEERQLIVRTEALGIKDESAFWLRDIDPDIQTVRIWQWRFLFGAAFTAVLFASIFGLLTREIYFHSILADLVIAVSVLALSWTRIRPIKVFRIRAKDGSLVVQLYTTKAKRFICEDFIEAVNNRMLKKQ